MKRKAQPHSELDWQDIFIFLVSSRCDSFRAAGRQLDLNPSTIGRRIARLEKTLGHRLYTPANAGDALCQLSKEGEAFLKAAEDMMFAYENLKNSSFSKNRSSQY
jgi:DNA-binding transcriptional LysR family regulator